MWRESTEENYHLVVSELLEGTNEAPSGKKRRSRLRWRTIHNLLEKRS